ncbi:CPBP family intramembrane glutamic endopeptidase [Paraburkholderia caledonica]|uniref:Membrane protease YdiL (CAAX protease family) n=1 Tax=Paraburkholderia caledonica TaxID=134536 RepID=A0AB73ILN3_9BURK|nr:membrane protease YdiL (CAAX protease family) [Paraburkholderia caledonica]
MLSVLALVVYSMGDGIRHFLLALQCHESVLCRHTAVGHADALASYAGSPELGGVALRGMTMLASMLWLISVLYPISLSLRSGPEWDFEWIATLPMPRGTLLCARIIERGLVNPIAWIALLTPSAVVASHSGAGWFAAVYAILVAVPLLLTVSSIWTILDLGLHLTLAPSTLRNLQAVLGIALTSAIFLIAYLRTPKGEGFAVMLADHTPAWSIWTPLGLANQIVSVPVGVDTFGLYGLLLLEVGLVTLLSLAFLRFQLRAGLVAHGARESGRAARVAAHSNEPDLSAGSFRLSPLKRRELTLLTRDRRFLAQFLGVPLLMIGSQFIFNNHLVGRLAREPGALASVAFCIGAYALIHSAVQTSTVEQGALWLLYTFPRSIMSVQWEKAQFYLAIALPFPVGVYLGCLALSPAAPMRFVVGSAFAIVGLMTYSAIAVALGVLFGANSRWSRSLHSYLYMLLVGFYAYALYSADWHREVPMLALCGALAVALWQKASDKVPYLLDSSAAPPSRVALADGLIAATIFFVFQFVAVHLLRKFVHGDSTSRVVLGYVCSGALTFALMRGTFAALKTRGVPRILGADNARSVGTGVAVGLLCASVGVCYLWLAGHYGVLPDTTQQRRLPPQARVAISLLAVLAAPFFEEFIFRGLIFGGMRRSLGRPASALGSAALFAIVHPLFSLAPLFVLGIGAAWVYDHKQTLVAPMLTHVTYNAVVICYSLFILTP